MLWLFQVDDWLERLIEEKGEDLYRMKGILSVSGSDHRYVFQVLPLLFLLLFSYDVDVTSVILLIIASLYCYFLILSCHGAMTFQGVHSTLDGCPGKAWGPDEKRMNKLVFIGRNLDENALRKGFKGCLA